MTTQPVPAPSDQRLAMIDNIIITLSRRVQKVTRPSERDELLKDIAYYNLYRRNVMHDITTAKNRSASVNR